MKQRHIYSCKESSTQVEVPHISRIHSLKWNEQRTINCLANEKTRYQMAYYDEQWACPNNIGIYSRIWIAIDKSPSISFFFVNIMVHERFKPSRKRILRHNQALWCIFVQQNSRPFQLCAWFCHRDDNRLIFYDLIRNWHLPLTRNSYFAHFTFTISLSIHLKINWKWKYARICRVHSIFCTYLWFTLRLFINLAKKQLQNRMSLVSCK